MRRSVVLLFVMLCCAVSVRAQFDAQIGQYMFMQSSYNPAAVGEGDLMRVYGGHRMDFTGIKGAPMTTVFSVSSPYILPPSDILVKDGVGEIGKRWKFRGVWGGNYPDFHPRLPCQSAYLTKSKNTICSIFCIDKQLYIV